MLHFRKELLERCMIMSENYLVSENTFEPVLDIIEHAKNRAICAANAEMIQMYWDIGKYVSDSVEDGGWGKSVVEDFSDFLRRHYPSAKGFSPQNIWRMKQFYETYRNKENSHHW